MTLFYIGRFLDRVGAQLAGREKTSKHVERKTESAKVPTLYILQLTSLTNPSVKRDYHTYLVLQKGELLLTRRDLWIIDDVRVSTIAPNSHLLLEGDRSTFRVLTEKL